jgi:hypothetical protein
MTTSPRPTDVPGFEPQPMVDWFSPPQLASTGLRAAMAAVFGSYADKREVQAALAAGAAAKHYDYSAEGETDFWLDFAADTGDGFDSTYAVSHVLGRESLRVAGAAGGPPLERGRLLVLGGDQVYPTANRELYQQRFVGPWRAAFPWDDSERCDLFAIPGNHDWYDGLTSFTRLFCQKRWIGGRRTQQQRSYFAIKLPHDWWLWGIDIQLHSDIDQPQMDFFNQIAERMVAESDGTPRLLLCTAEPTWVYCDAEPADRPSRERGWCRSTVDPTRYDALDYFHRRVIAHHKIQLAAVLSGDLHHYTRYESPSPQAVAEPASELPPPAQLITSGGAGAYVYGTHHMPEALELPGNRAPVTYRRRSVYPGLEESRSLATLGRILRLPWHNTQFSVLLLAPLYLIWSWTLESTSKMLNDFPSGIAASLVERLAELAHPLPVLQSYIEILKHGPSSTILALGVIGGLGAYSLSGKTYETRRAEYAAFALGALHGAAHLFLAGLMIWGIASFNVNVLGIQRVDRFLPVMLFVGEMAMLGWLFGGWLFAAYLKLATLLSGAHMNDVYSAQAIPDYKNFLRLRIARDGSLTIHPLAIPRVPRQWTYTGDTKPREPWYAPADGREIAVERIEPPITFPAPKRSGRSS